ncbi:branched-subunit amino acid transport protein AzlD [Homoserinimonas aerilata]|uniref:Branched-subunit amino acid transport protein AzlD n=1 Tax=Homoserinimonas aerilata TaxID=1162970 RepID=A0A542YIL5_9MICO|nr:AzlD domain-containing protein [Homoserinimonas aerilata]TQL47871.1 branched-subunit amino acid transport protein AzlD [Homoserinimonas aerilata]
MTLWLIIIVASLACLALKLSGYLVPPAFMERPRPARVANLLTVALLAALVATQAVGSAEGLVLDARVPALFVAAVLFSVRVPFIVVIVAAAATAAAIRAVFGG